MKKNALRLNVGCGPHRARGWLNIDVVSVGDIRPDLIADFRTYTFTDLYDRIYMGHFIEHIAPELVSLAFRKAWAILKEGGQLAVVAPDKDRADSMDLSQHIRDAIALHEGGWDGAGHKWIPTEVQVRRLLERAGFTIIAEGIRNVPRDWPVVSYDEWQLGFVAEKRG